MPRIQTQTLEPGAFLILAVALVAATSLVLAGAEMAVVAASALVIVLPVALVLTLFMISGVAGNKASAAFLAVVIVFVSTASFRFREYEDKSIDFQILIKLGAIGLMLLSVTLGSVLRNAVTTLKGTGIWMIFLAYLVSTVVLSETFVFSFVTSVSVFVCGLYCFNMVGQLGSKRMIDVMLVAAVLICVISVVVFFVLPDFGRMRAWNGVVFGPINRMRGITNSANAIGTVAAFTMIVGILYFRDFSGWMRIVAQVAIVIALLSLYLSENRMSIIGVFFAIGVASMLQSQTGAKLVLAGLLAVIGVILLAAFPDAILTTLSRSGNASEITSGTGRTLIWTVVVETWLQSPIVGYGYSTSISVLPKDPRLFGVAAHAHNAYLEILFAGGIVGLALFLAALFWTIRMGIRAGAARELGLFSFYVLRGLTEPAPFFGLVGFNAFAFFTVIGLIAVKAHTEMPQPRGREVSRSRNGLAHRIAAKSPGRSSKPAGSHHDRR